MKKYLILFLFLLVSLSLVKLVFNLFGRPFDVWDILGIASLATLISFLADKGWKRKN